MTFRHLLPLAMIIGLLPLSCNSTLGSAKPSDGDIDGDTETVECNLDCSSETLCTSDAKMGCTCVVDATVGPLCMAVCEQDSDCPSPPTQTLTCSEDGICMVDSALDGDIPLPDGDNPHPDGDLTCELDCTEEGACPPNASLGCECRMSPEKEEICVPVCNQDSDCPNHPTLTLVCSDDGFCTPGDEPDGDGPDGDFPDGDGPHPDGDVSCSLDCTAEGACPPQASLGCTCRITPERQEMCVPVCNQDSDCPSNPTMSLACSDDGYCVPGDAPDGDATDGDTVDGDDDNAVDGDDDTAPDGDIACSLDCSGEGNCPADASMGCACRISPQSEEICVALCVVSADCPSPPDVSLQCDDAGYCVPGEAPDGDTTDGDQECSLDCGGANACPPDASMGCTCAIHPQQGEICVPLCEQTSDCPSPPDLTLVCNPDGICVPEQQQ